MRPSSCQVLNRYTCNSFSSFHGQALFDASRPLRLLVSVMTCSNCQQRQEISPTPASTPNSHSYLRHLLPATDWEVFFSFSSFFFFVQSTMHVHPLHKATGARARAAGPIRLRAHSHTPTTHAHTHTCVLNHAHDSVPFTATITQPIEAPLAQKPDPD